MAKNSSNNDEGDVDFNIYRMLRIARGLSVNYIADELKVTPTYIRAIERGDRQPSGKLLQEYLRVLRVNENVIKTFSKNAKNYTSFEKLLRYLLNLIIKIGDTTELKKNRI